MKTRFFFLTIIFVLVSNYAFSKPMCQILYDRIYNEASYEDASIKKNINKKTIGIRLLKTWNENALKFYGDDKKKTYTAPGYELVTNSDGYYIVGKITTKGLATYPYPKKKLK